MLCVLLGLAVHSWWYSQRFMPGTTVGSVDLSGMTWEEGSQALHSAYDNALSQEPFYIFASQEAYDSLDPAAEVAAFEGLAEQLSAEEARSRRRVWMVDAASLGAHVDIDGLLQQAWDARSGNALTELFGNAPTRSFEPVITYDEQPYDELLTSLNATLAQARQDATVVFNADQGYFEVIAPIEGTAVNEEALNAAMAQSLWGESTGFVATLRPDVSPTTLEHAQVLRDTLNGLLSQPVLLNLNNAVITFNASSLGQAMVVTVEQDGAFSVNLDADEAHSSLIAQLTEAHDLGEYTVTFENTDDGPLVHLQNPVMIPDVDGAISTLDDQWLTPARIIGLDPTADPQWSGQPFEVSVGLREAPTTMSLDEALELGVVQRISRYTTSFNNNSSTRNRTDNIKLICDILNNTIVEANGGTWSFNDRAGERTAERGFKSAGAIVGEEYSDDIGGGVCQVATTIFNAVLESGYPVLKRSNHTLYVASYPAGRDAAVSWPNLDFVWENDSPSDVLMGFSYTDETITVTLYGRPPGYGVSIETKDWVPGKEHGTRRELDETLAPGTERVKVQGTDGMSIQVIETVTNPDGSVRRTDTFDSHYSPVTEVVIYNPPLPAEEPPVQPVQEPTGTDPATIPESVEPTTGDQGAAATP